MLKNYLLVALRTLRREKGYAALNVAGLAVGPGCCLLLGLFVRHETSYDRFHADADRLHRVLTTQPDPGGEPVTTARGAFRLGPALDTSFAAVDGAVRVATGSVEIDADGATWEGEVLFADRAFFDVFSFPLVAGGAAALAQPDGLVLSASTAARWFGDGAAVGRPVEVPFADDEVRTFTVGAVAADAPAASSIVFDAILPIGAYELTLPAMARAFILDNWTFPNVATFVRLADGGEAEALDAGLRDFVAAHYGEAAGETALALQPMHAAHFSPDVRGPLVAAGNPLHATVLGGLAVLVLLVACINFTTLALGRSVRRAREVGLRKTLGAHAGQVRGQFWGEAFLTTAAAALLALALVALFLPTFNRLTNLALTLAPLARPAALLVFLGLLVGVSFLAGGYPALVLSRMRPSAVLKGRAGLGGARFATALVVVQFALSTALVAVVVVVSAQMRFLDTAPLGFERERVVLLKMGGSASGKAIYPRLRDALGGHAAVEQIAGSMVVPFDKKGWPAGLQLGDTASVEVQMNAVDEHFTGTLGMEIVSGTDFAAARVAGEAVPVLVNETLMRTLGWTEFRGKQLPLKGSIVSAERAEIVGVVRDFHIQPLHEPVQPVILSPLLKSGALAATVRLAPGRTAEGLAAVEAAWERAAPDAPFEPLFLDEVVAAKYEAERRWQALLRWAAGFALALAGFGLLGMAALSATRRTREVGIRKVMGASVSSVVALLSLDLLRLVALGFVLAVPLAWFAAERWLEGFAYRIDLGPGLFLLAGGLALAVALVAVSGQAFRAATANPADALRYE
jgi:putative ABC transport system permease protein